MYNDLQNKFPLNFEERLFLRHKSSYELLQDFSLCDNLNWINNYIPNIKNYPISFTSITGLNDYIICKVASDIHRNGLCHLSYDRLGFDTYQNNLRSIEIVKGTYDNHSAYIPYWTAEYSQVTVLQTVLKAIWLDSMIRKYDYNLMSYYTYVYNDMRNRKIGEWNIPKDGYDSKYFMYQSALTTIGGASFGDSYNKISVCCSVSDVDFNYKIFTVSDIDKVNFIKLVINPDLEVIKISDLVESENKFYEGNTSLEF